MSRFPYGIATRAAGGGIVGSSTDGRSVTGKLAAIFRTFAAGNVPVAVPVVVGGGAVVAALELTVGGAGHQLHVIQSAVVVAARALSRELTADQHRAGPHQLAVLRRPSVVALQASTAGT